MSTTRASARQQEFEGQLTTLVGMMEQQQQRQEQLAIEHREQMQELVRRQQQQMETLLQEQYKQMERVDARQHATEQTMGALQQDLESTKTIMGKRLQATEESLGVLQTSHQTFAEELLANQQALRDEIQVELHDRKREQEEGTKSKSQLQAAAPEFIPSSVSFPTGALSSHSAVPRPPPYDGRSDWDAYRAQFEMLAQVNQWSEEEKATFLAVSLRGTALTVLSNVAPERRYVYQDLAAALQKRFGSAHQAELHRMKLKNRTRRREEALPELLEDIERLARLAYPDAKPEMLEVLAKDQFIDSLPDEDLRIRVRQNRPQTLQQTLETALELESYQLASKQRVKTIRGVHIEHRQQHRRESRPDASSEILDKLQQCIDILQHQTAETTKRRSHQRGYTKDKDSNRRESIPRMTCWNCGELGHLRRNCRKPPKAQAVGAETESNPGNGQ